MVVPGGGPSYPESLRRAVVSGGGQTRSDEHAPRHGEPPSGEWRRRFPGEAASVPAARAWVRELLAGHVAGAALDDVQLLLCEVVTNAVAHSTSGRAAGGQVTIWVACASRAVHVEVADAGSATSAPVAGIAAADSDGGRGLWLVDMIATAWGSRHDGEMGRTVWFQVTA